ncbi:AAA family ATPase [Acinetobacter baumannii]|uniref:ATP-dependent nuclease n=1 Tax=Acinetobacter calcoaceticus/baumannii complex TaxID=909768 RepID=UPI0013D3F5E5|nr:MULTISPECIES: AAA family ATPase [Acinetobacter calcoaceticus/baumannii complex]MDH2540482.1 AAA family ATPase [Acinetobacter baumannii]
MFVIKERNKTLTTKNFPVFSLTKENWNDFGTYCLFELQFHQSHEKNYKIGLIKILQIDSSNTQLPKEFSKLDDNYISLGQDLSFYKTLSETVEKPISIEVLNALNDIAWQPNKGADFEHKPDYRNALLRENTAHNAFRFGRSIVLNESYTEDFSFKYRVNIEGSESPFEISIDLDETDKIPGRIVGIIGRNAVGKTQLMGALAQDLVQVGRKSKKSLDSRDERFIGERPIFNKIITVSYSAFDKFIRPSKPQRSYAYCGIRNKNGNISIKFLMENYKQNLKIIKESNREYLWISYMMQILDNYNPSFENFLQDEMEVDKFSENDPLSSLSSGQSILAHFVTALIAKIQNNTLVLFDEPETHLHPNAVASLFNVLNALLKKYDSFAIIATHSPIVIQEIPSKRVILLTREENSTISTKMEFETFGENISELTRHVFDTISIPNYYKKVLKKLSKTKSYEQVCDMFENNLSFNAKAFLSAQYGENQ